MHAMEYMRPRLEEVPGALPAAIGRFKKKRPRSGTQARSMSKFDRILAAIPAPVRLPDGADSPRKFKRSALHAKGRESQDAALDNIAQVSQSTLSAARNP